MNPREDDERIKAAAHQYDEPGDYEIRVKGHLDAHWSAWFDGLSLNRESDGSTVIRGPVADQAALHGMLQRIRDLGVELVSVIRLNSG
jgi:hypothetical protein